MYVCQVAVDLGGVWYNLKKKALRILFDPVVKNEKKTALCKPIITGFLVSILSCTGKATISGSLTKGSQQVWAGACECII